MLPVILSCSDKAQSEEIINKFIADNNISPHSVHRIARAEKKKEIAVSQMRQLNELFYHHHSQQRVIIIEDFDTASEEAQNALLKILEEKTVNTQFFLVTSNYLSVLPTIRSRSRIEIMKGDHACDDVEDVTTALLIKDPKLLSHSSVVNMNAEKAVQLCDNLIMSLRGHLISDKTQTPHLIKEIIKIKQLLLQNNLNPQLGIDYLILSQIAR